MISLLSFSILFLLPTAASTVPLRVLLMVAGSLSSFIPMVIGLTVHDCCEGRVGVKFILVFERWLQAVNTCSNCSSYASQCDLNASISYETLGTGGDLSGEDFQNSGTFIPHFPDDFPRFGT